MTSRQDGGQSYLDTALDRRRVRELLSEQVMPALFPGRALAPLLMQYSSYKAGKRHVALYRLQFDPPLGPAAPLATVTFGRTSRLQKAYERVIANGAPRSHSAMLLLGQSCLVEIFPADSKLPLLWQAADAHRAGQLLMPMLEGYANVRVLGVEVLRYRPGRRCVLAYEIEHSGGSTEVVAKLYSTSSRANSVAAKLAVLANQTVDEFTLPSAIGEPSNGLLLMERLLGHNLGDQLETSTSRTDNEDAVRTAADGLAAFHRLRLERDERRSLRTELTNLTDRLKPIRDVAPALADEISGLLDDVNTRLTHVPPAVDCVIHGEYKPNQLLLSQGRIAVVDLDRACIGDPAIDVGNFTAVLRKEVILERHTHLAGLDDIFTDEYASANPVEGILERARLFQVVAFLRMLTRHFERAPQCQASLGDAWPPLVLLSEARRSLRSS